MVQSRKVAFCPSCCNVAPQVLLYYYQYTGQGFSYSSDEIDVIPEACYIAKCETCSSAVIYTAIGDVASPENFNRADLTYPTPDNLDDSVPQDIKKLYKEAVRIKWLSPSAFAGQIRRALEAVCLERKATGRNLSAMLKDLADKGEIPQTLTKMTKVIRLFGNQGVHAGEDAVRPAHVHSINDFFKAVIEYIYVAPSKILHLEKMLNSSVKVKKES